VIGLDRRLLMFGDGQLWLDEVVFVLTRDEGDDPVICDASECGMYMASKHVKAGFRVKRATLKEVLDTYADYEVEAWNNLIARQLKDLGVMKKTAKELMQKLEVS